MENIIPIYFVLDGGTNSLSGCSVDLGLLSWLVGVRLDSYRGFPTWPFLLSWFLLCMSGNQWEISARYFVYPSKLCTWGMGKITARQVCRPIGSTLSCTCASSQYFSPFLQASATLVSCSSISSLGTLLPFSHWHRCPRARVSSSLGAHIATTYTIHYHLRIATWPLTFQYPIIMIGAKAPRPIAASPPINLILWGTGTIGISQKTPGFSSSVNFLLL